MKNSIEKFEERNMAAFQTLAMIAQSEKQLKAQKEEIKKILLDGMEKHNITSIDNDIVRINYIPESESVSLDTKALLKENPMLYHDIEAKYNKRTGRKAYIKITVK